MKYLTWLMQKKNSSHAWAWGFLVLFFVACGVRAQDTSLLTAPPVIGTITPIPQPSSADPLKVALGARLFNDPNLSLNGERACSSCHDIDTNGADNHRLDMSIQDTKLMFNTQTVFNAALSFPRMNPRGGVQTLEQQAELSLDSPRIMGMNVAKAVQSIKTEKGMMWQFVMVYGHGPDPDSLLDAISAYEGSLLTPDSAFDRWLNGDAKAMSPEQVLGYRQFSSLGCISCHQGVAIGGNLFEKSGVFHELVSPQPQIMRVPSLRNVAVTAPYFHDGSVPTLQQAVRDMGHAQLGRNLSDAEVSAVVAFLQSLTGDYQGRQLAAPP